MAGLRACEKDSRARWAVRRRLGSGGRTAGRRAADTGRAAPLRGPRDSVPRVRCRAPSERSRGAWGRSAGCSPASAYSRLDLVGDEAPVPPPECGRQGGEVRMAGRMRKAFEPQLEQPALAVLVAPRQLAGIRDHLRRGRPSSCECLLEHAAKLVVHAGMQQLDEERLLAVEVRVERTAAEAGRPTISSTLDPEKPRRRNTSSAASRSSRRVSACCSARVRRLRGVVLTRALGH